jgi:DNA-binding SARP family transcriptional activator
MEPQSAQRPVTIDSPGTIVHLFAGPYVTCGATRYSVPQGSRRLLAFVALGRGRVERPHAAGALWPFGDDNRAAGNLRSALWRLRRAGIDIIVADKWSLTLGDHVVVDVRAVGEWANRLVQGTHELDDLSLMQLPPDALCLLPGWYDDWAIIERERTRQRVLHAMEALSRHLSELRRYDEAIEVGLAAVTAEPLRESAQRVLIEAYLAQGHWSDADRVFAAFQSVTRLELGVEVSRDLVATMAAAGGPFARRALRPSRGAGQLAVSPLASAQ